MTDAAGALLVALILAGMGLYVLAPVRRRGDRGLFQRLAQASGLTAREVRLLRSLAREACPEEPALLFVRRTLFEKSAAERGLEAALVETLRRKVYGP
ncbi:MAG: hypothetical protein ACK44W_04205 [Planctomycetota bacterium]